MIDPLDQPVRDALTTFLDAAPPAPPTVEWVTVNERRHQVAIAVCAALLVVATVGAIMVSRLHGPDRTIGPAESTPAPLAPSTSMATMSPLTTIASPEAQSTLTTTASGGSWQVRTDPSSISRSQVFDMTGGPTGFVAVGEGFESGKNQGDGKNHGHVWFSPDGITWQEAAFAQFDTMWVTSVKATSTAFYVVASPNTDRVPGGGPSVLFSSPDGITWVPHGNPPGRIDVVGDLLVSISDKHPATTNAQGTLTSDQQIQASTDGLSWAPATFVGADPDAQMSFPVTPIVHSNGTSYVMTAESTAETDPVTRIWSTTDGRTWTALPDSPFIGQLVGTPDGPMLVANTAWQECAPSAAMPTDQAGLEARWEQLWTCVGDTRLTLLPDGSNAWRTLPTTGIPRTQVAQPVVSDGGWLVMPVTTPTRHLTLVASHDGGITWLPQAVDLDLDPATPDSGGSPPTTLAATFHGITVIAVPVSNPAHVGQSTSLIVGQS